MCIKKIYFVFTNNKILHYWLKYTLKYLKNIINLDIKYYKLENRIAIESFLEINFVSETCPDKLRGRIENMYWVEDLFDNNFKLFFKEIISQEVTNWKNY